MYCLHINVLLLYNVEQLLTQQRAQWFVPMWEHTGLLQRDHGGVAKSNIQICHRSELEMY